MQVTVLPLIATVLGLFSWSQLASSRDLSICLSIPIAFELTTEFFQWASYNSFYFFKILIDIFIIVPKRWVLLYNYLGSICLTIQQSYWLKPKSVWLSLHFPDGGNLTMLPLINSSTSLAVQVCPCLLSLRFYHLPGILLLIFLVKWYSVQMLISKPSSLYSP